MPNVFGLAPGKQIFDLIVDHTTGMLVIDGTATASANGQTVTTDAGTEIMAPGWHGMTPPGTEQITNTTPPPPPAPPSPPPSGTETFQVSLSLMGRLIQLHLV